MRHGKFQAFQGADGWYVAFERVDGFHWQPLGGRSLSHKAALAEARRRNRELDDEDSQSGTLDEGGGR